MLAESTQPPTTLRAQVNFYLEQDKGKVGVFIDLMIMVLIFVFSTFFVIETFSLSDAFRQALKVGNLIILGLFSFEYLLRLWSAENRLSYLFNVFSLIDLFAILPLWFGFFDSRLIQVFRWFRVLRFLRFLWGDQRFYIWISPRAVIFARTLFTLFAIVFIYSGFIYQFEHFQNPQQFKTFLDSFYFSVVTMTTVGFGDIAPVSSPGRLFTVLMIMTGVTLVPWQVGDLIRELANPTVLNTQNHCSHCSLEQHDTDALFCKRCGTSLTIETAHK